MAGIEQATKRREQVIKLTPEDLAAAHPRAAGRTAHARGIGADPFGPRRPDQDLRGMIGEIAVCRYLGISRRPT